jgi:hypothetical protein
MGPAQFAVLWFSFNADGTQQWFTAVAARDGNRLHAAAMNRPVNGRFGPYFDPAQVERTPFGDITFDFTGCDAGTVSWRTPSGTGSAPIARITRLAGVECRRAPP